jgi:hypothetical protein
MTRAIAHIMPEKGGGLAEMGRHFLGDEVQRRKIMLAETKQI